MVRGRVVGPDGRPVAAASVWLLSDEDGDLGTPAPKLPSTPAASSGTDGGFVLSGFPARRRFSLQICHDGFEPGGIWMTAPPTRPVRVVLRPSSRIAGRVLDPRGRPVPGARVEARTQDVIRIESEAPPLPCAWPASSAQGLTDAKGRFSIGPLREGPYVVSIRAEGFLESRTEPQSVTFGRSVEGLEVMLDPGVVLAGRVVSPRGAPLARISVRLHGEGPKAMETMTGEDGTFRWAGIEPGDAIVEAVDSGDPGGEVARQAVGLETGEAWVELTLAQRDRREVRGKVTGPDGNGLDGARVVADPVAGGAAEVSSPSAVSEAGGTFALELPDGSYHLSARRSGYGRGELAEELVVEGSRRDGLEIRLPRGAAIAGRVLGLTPEELTRVKVGTLEGDAGVPGSVDAGGLYRIEGLAPGSYVVTARMGERLVEGNAMLAVDVAETALDLSFPPTFPVTGRVRSAAGEPVPRATLELKSSQGTSRQAFSLSDGTFLAELEPGDYQVTAQADGYVPASAPVRVEASPVDGVEIRLDRSAVLHGQVLGLEPGERVQSVYAEGPSYRSGQATPDGGYRVPGAGPGEWRVVAFVGGRRAVGRVTLAPGQSDAVLDLVLPTGERTLSGRIAGLDDPRAFHLELLRDDLPEPINGYIGADGSFRVRWLDDGTYRLQVVQKGQVFHEQFVEIQGDREIVIEIQR